MIDTYNKIVLEYKKYLEENSKYYTINAEKPLVVKGYTSASPYFPIVVIQNSNMTSTNYCTIDKIERYNEMYLTIDIYTKDKTINNDLISSQVINDELTDLTINYFEFKNLQMTLCMETPNMDKNILRRTIQFQGMVGNARGNIIRR